MERRSLGRLRRGSPADRRQERAFTKDQERTIRSKGRYWEEVIRRDDGAQVHEILCNEARELYRDVGAAMLWACLYHVRACNARDELLAALEGVAAAHAGTETCDMPLWLEAVEAAIAKAKGD